jgi:hypothetical protein
MLWSIRPACTGRFSDMVTVVVVDMSAWVRVYVMLGMMVQSFSDTEYG